MTFASIRSNTTLSSTITPLSLPDLDNSRPIKMAAIPATEQIKVSLKESLLGKEAPEGVTHESKARFLQHASIEEEDELYMSQDDFVNAIAPPDEDYVSSRNLVSNYFAQAY